MSKEQFENAVATATAKAVEEALKRVEPPTPEETTEGIPKEFVTGRTYIHGQELPLFKVLTLDGEEWVCKFEPKTFYSKRDKKLVQAHYKKLLRVDNFEEAIKAYHHNVSDKEIKVIDCEYLTYKGKTSNPQKATDIAEAAASVKKVEARVRG